MKNKCFSIRILFAMLSALMALSFTSCDREAETAPLFQGQSTVDQAAGAIQNRVQLYLHENQ